MNTKDNLKELKDAVQDAANAMAAAYEVAAAAAGDEDLNTAIDAAANAMSATYDALDTALAQASTRARATGLIKE